MAKVGMPYPQVEPRVTALMDRRVVTLAPGRRVADALRAALRAEAEVVVLGARRAVRRRELERAVQWGLGALDPDRLSWDGLPVVSEDASEIAVRRLVLAGVSMILVRGGRDVVGVVDADRIEVARPTQSVADRLDRLEQQDRDALVWLLRVAGKVGEGLSMPVFAVGGFVRDLLLGRTAPDVDLLVEGDGVTFARRLHEEVGGRLVIHGAFRTASIEGAASRSRRPISRIDIASGRRERYDAAGALPVVSEASVGKDLERRDFSVNAMAIALQPSAFGRLLDPLCGQRDLVRRTLRPLHPLSFVEDPTRIFRAARYAVRLGFRLDRLGRKALTLALDIGTYPALSGQRLSAELALLMVERRGFAGLERLLGWNALRLWDREFRASVASVRHVRAAAQLSQWARKNRIELDAMELATVAALVDQRADVGTRCLARLAITGERGERLRAATTARALARRLDDPTRRRPSQIAEALRACAPPVLVGAWLRGGRLARRRLQWFLSRARDVRPLLSGDEVVSLGVPRGPRVGECLTRLRQLQLDDVVTTRRQAHAFVIEWVSPHRDIGLRRRRLERDPDSRGREQGMRRPRRLAQTGRGVST
jgi:tRNA nucleotidyltransferase (CCA-adding enzyme)